ncbi:MAG: hypothetical protein IJX99_04475 [Clostridia bacterium]|nr:hypothetical protein [Clostridia bacterium]
MKKKYSIAKNLSVGTFFIIMMMINIFQVNATNSTSTTNSSTTTSCTHTVYSTNSPSTYHYTYCKTCGKCKSRTRHSVSSTSNYRK